MSLFDLNEFFKLSSALHYNLSAASLNRYTVLMYIIGDKRLVADEKKDREYKGILMEYYDSEARKGAGHGRCEDINAMPIIDSVHVKYYGTCGSAMAMNDVTERGKDTTAFAISEYKKRHTMHHIYFPTP